MIIDLNKFVNLLYNYRRLMIARENLFLNDNLFCFFTPIKYTKIKKIIFYALSISIAL